MNEPERAKLIEALRRFAEIGGDHLYCSAPWNKSNPIRSAVQAALSELDERGKQIDREEADHIQTIKERDAHEDRLNDIFSALGMNEYEREWTSLRDPSLLAVQIAEEKCKELDERGRRIEELEKQVAALRADYNHAELVRYRGLDRAGGVSND